jgi:hypothetical protein
VRLANETVGQYIALETFPGVACFRVQLGRTSLNTEHHRVRYQAPQRLPPVTIRGLALNPRPSALIPGWISSPWLTVRFHKLIQCFLCGRGRYHFCECFRLDGQTFIDRCV